MEAKDTNDKEILFESISALVDDELSITEKSHLIAEIKQDVELLEKWRHFYIIKTVMQQHACSVSTNEFVRKIMVHTSTPDPDNIKRNSLDLE